MHEIQILGVQKDDLQEHATSGRTILQIEKAARREEEVINIHGKTSSPPNCHLNLFASLIMLLLLRVEGGDLAWGDELTVVLGEVLIL